MNPSLTIEVPAVALKENSERVSDLATGVAVLNERVGHLTESVQDLAESLKNQGSSTELYRSKQQEQINQVINDVSSVKNELQVVKTDVALIAERGFWAWLRKNVAVLGFLVTLIVALSALITWLVTHYKH